MIMQCQACGHLFERHNPSSVWEENFRLTQCPACEARVRPPLLAIRLVDWLLVFQFIALLLLSDSIIFREGQWALYFIGPLLLSSLLLYLLNSGKGQPFTLRARGRHGMVREQGSERSP